MKFSPEDRLILSSVKIQPSPEELEEINLLISLIRDWDYLISTIIDRGIGPLLFKKLPFLTNSSQIPEFVKIKLQQVYYKTFSRSTILYEHFRKIAKAFTSQNIPLIALKGIYLSEWLYQDIGLRQFSDIDLFVKEEDGERCITILEAMGYKPSSIKNELSKLVFSQFDNDIVHYLPMTMNGVSVEIHIKLHKKREKYCLILQNLWLNSVNTNINGVNVLVFNINDLLIHLCLHLDKHFQSGKIQFTCFNDITNVLQKYSKTLNWNALNETCQLYNCKDIVFKYIVMVHKYMNATVPVDIIKKEGNLLTSKDEKLFSQYLKGNEVEASTLTLSSHFRYLRKNKKFIDKVSYLLDVIFPTIPFMVDKYRIKRPALVLFYYPYRYYIGIRGVMNYLKKKVVGR